MWFFKIFKRKKKNKKKTDKELPLMEHLEELRKRLLISIAVIIVLSIISFIFIDKILAFITGPVGKLIFINPTEAFMARIKLSFFRCPSLLFFLQNWG